MTRVLCLLLSVTAGACAALLLVVEPPVHYAGKTGSCPGIIVSSEGGDSVYSAHEPGFQRACEDKQREWSVLAGLAALVAVGAGSVAHFSRRDHEVAALRPRPSPGVGEGDQ